MIVAAAVGMARVVNLDHYFSDVMAAAVIGLATASFLAPLILDQRRAWPLRTPWQWFRCPAQ
jgi:membrane-associated phospholipid phosphatase